MTKKSTKQQARFLCNRQIEADFKLKYAQMILAMSKNIIAKISKDEDKPNTDTRNI